jgi:hypothetical protein
MRPINRRRVLHLGVPAALAVAGVRPVVAEPLDGKGNDVCPCFFGIETAALVGDGTVEVSGHCGVANPPEDVTVHVQVRGDRGARASGSATFECTGAESDGSTDAFSVAAAIRGVNRFESGDDVRIDARAHINPDDGPALGAGKWSWNGSLS